MTNSSFEFDRDSIMRAVRRSLADRRVSMSCPNCNREISFTFRQVANQDTIICEGCRNSIQLADREEEVRKLLDGQ